MALAVLALWLLSLLSPMHQTSRLVADMASAGVTSVSDWTLCISTQTGTDGKAAAQVLCPAKGIGKDDLDLPPPGDFAGLMPDPFPAGLTVADREWRPDSWRMAGQPRAPPLA